MSVGENIKKRRKQLHMNAETLADKLGVAASTVYRWENGGIEKVDSQIIAQVADALSTSPSALMGWETGGQGSGTAVRVPVYGSIPAGIPMEAIEDIEDWEEIPADWMRGGKEYFCLRIHGSSMYPRYEDGDVVVFRKQDTCENGQDCAVMVNGGDATFKRVRLTAAGVTLQPLNPEFDPLVFSNIEVAELPVRIIGVGVELRHKMP